MEQQKCLLYYFGFNISRLLIIKSLQNLCLPPMISHQLWGVGRNKNYEDPILSIGIVTNNNFLGLKHFGTNICWHKIHLHSKYFTVFIHVCFFLLKPPCMEDFHIKPDFLCWWLLFLLQTGIGLKLPKNSSQAKP